MDAFCLHTSAAQHNFSCHAMTQKTPQCSFLRDWCPFRNASDFLPMSMSGEPIRALKNLHSSDLTIYAVPWRDARHCFSGSILTVPTRSFSNLKLDVWRFALEWCWNDAFQVGWWSIPHPFWPCDVSWGPWVEFDDDMFHVNPGLFRGSACFPDCKPSAIWEQYDYSITVTGTSLKFFLHVESTSSQLTLGSILALLALPWRKVPLCRQLWLQPDSHAEHHVTTRTRIWKTYLRNFSEPWGNNNWPIPL